MKPVEVVAGALYDASGRVLIAQRPPGKALAGRWEFPGGKLHEGESPYEALVRELREELGVEVLAGERLMRYPHEYPDRFVWLDMWIVSEWRGDRVFLSGSVYGIKIEALFAIDGAHVTAFATDPGWPWRGQVTNYVDRKLKKYMHPTYDEP